ncbi:hypothetical protein DFJ67_6951 [Asanoa ferruginea]|uniref:Uncharacterized protein n=1 Tax=Asanoa ferruginea TaxID=53367 RepID=A0A3D9ZUM1_9ACTN|nr:hypothetical protein DFJ67_6951 [Asanoa ferruginea]GIF47471.1 hypothetical protein Afe04nite_20100 [Asanoa ferruginea]
MKQPGRSRSETDQNPGHVIRMPPAGQPLREDTRPQNPALGAQRDGFDPNRAQIRAAGVAIVMNNIHIADNMQEHIIGRKDP